MTAAEVLEKAWELSRALETCQPVEAFRDAEVELLNDEMAQELLRHLTVARARLRRGVFPEGGAEALAEEVQRLESALASRPSYQRYLRARRGVDDLVGTILNILNYALTGEDSRRGGCGSGGCGSGGCGSSGCGAGGCALTGLPRNRRARAAVRSAG